MEDAHNQPALTAKALPPAPDAPQPSGTIDSIADLPADVEWLP